ncbi:MAG: NifB/NifX family molybdenum-iron cluster-binding protein [Candidatus Aminicenantes bacterium]|nr:NifB/NifX family molybdenum-iron cluster-binding protein [Candidatus Aminicenantes bacterium]
MKIAVSTENGFVSAHFGRCPTYTIVDIRDGRVLARQEIPNPGHQPGFLPQYLSDKGVEAIIAGGMGPRAQDLFADKNIQTLIGVQGPLDEVIAKFLRGELEAGQDLCDHGHHHEGPCRHEESPGPTGVAAPVEGKICVTTRGPDLEAEIDPNFGRAAYFLIVDQNTLEFRSFANPSAQASHGAGIQSAQFVAGQGVSAVLTGEVGPNARRVLESAGIRVISMEKSSVREAIAELTRR